jgi:hypothetical protein
MVRVQRKRTRGYRLPENTVSVTRPGKYGNPFFLANGFIYVAKNPGSVLWVPFGGNTIDDVLALYKQWLLGGLKSHELPEPPDLTPLKGKNLACFCKLGNKCHADVIIEILNES